MWCTWRSRSVFEHTARKLHSYRCRHLRHPPAVSECACANKNSLLRFTNRSKGSLDRARKTFWERLVCQRSRRKHLVNNKFSTSSSFVLSLKTSASAFPTDTSFTSIPSTSLPPRHEHGKPLLPSHLETILKTSHSAWLARVFANYHCPIDFGHDGCPSWVDGNESIQIDACFGLLLHHWYHIAYFLFMFLSPPNIVLATNFIFHLNYPFVVYNHLYLCLCPNFFSLKLFSFFVLSFSTLSLSTLTLHQLLFAFSWPHWIPHWTFFFILFS